MYFPLNMGIFQPAMLVYRRGSISWFSEGHQGEKGEQAILRWCMTCFLVWFPPVNRVFFHSPLSIYPPTKDAWLCSFEVLALIGIVYLISNLFISLSICLSIYLCLSLSLIQSSIYQSIYLDDSSSCFRFFKFAHLSYEIMAGQPTLRYPPSEIRGLRRP